MSSTRFAIFAFSALALAVPATARAQYFQPTSIQPEGIEYRQAASGDLNGDGKIDLVALRFAFANDPTPMWVVRINDGNGNFLTQSFLNASGSAPPTIADADGDGRADIIVPSTYAVTVFWGDGTGFFGAASTDVSGLVAASSVAVGDLNGDNVPDLAVSARSFTAGLGVFPGAGNRQFGSLVTISDIPPSDQVAIGNADGDSIPDLFVLVSPSLSSQSLRVLRGFGGLTFEALTPMALPAVSLAMSVADVDGDGITEAVVVERAREVDIITAQQGILTVRPIPGVSPAAIPPAVTDVDGDGRLDIIIAPSSGTSAVALISQNDGTFSATPGFPISGLTPRWAVFGDVDADGAVDIVAGAGSATIGAYQISVTRHVPPLRLSAFATSATAGPDGHATITAEALVDSGHTDVSLSWFEAGTAIGTGNRLFLSLPIGTHTLMVVGSTASGLKASAITTTTISAVVTPATEATVSAIQNTLESKLDVTLSSRASQQSVNDVAARVASIQSGIGALQTYLDAPISSRASAADLTAVGTKVDQLQALLPSSSSLSALTQAVNALAPSISASQNRLAIEQALARGDRIAAFYLPTAQGGQLDLVRSIVVDVIDKNEAAGGATLAVLKARRVIIDADGRKAAGDYRGAYLLYVAAYQVVGI